jgi:energy-coupling factor transporter ATP-binding protein EcfA2
MPFDIEFQDVSFQYEGAHTPALQHVNLAVRPGEIVLLTGPAGSGKTTLCSCINGLVPHYHEGSLTGQVLVRGYDTKRARIGGLSSLVGLVFQDPESQLVTASVADEVAFGPENLGVPREEITRRVAEALQATRLTGYDERDPFSLSGGEQQATVIAAIYAMHPEIYVMDEPLANLDPAGRAQVLRLVIEVARRRGKTLFLVEHSLEETLPFVERLIVLDGGRLVRDGPVEQVLAAGDIPGVFTRPPIVRLAEGVRLDPLPLTPQDFYARLQHRYPLGRYTEAATQEPAPPDGPAVIEFQDVHFSYNGQHAALDGVNLQVGRGELVAILGRNGSGKTTLVRHIIGLLQPARGRVTVLGQDASRTPVHELARRVGFCFQNPNHQLVAFNVLDEINFGLTAHGIAPEETAARIQEALEFVGLQEYRQAEIFDLGKGQRQRLALASVIALHPDILVIDEPTTGQDPRMAQDIFEILKRLNQAGTTVLLITHNLGLAAEYATRAVVVRAGRIDFDGSFRQLLPDLERLKANSLELPQTTLLASLLAAHGVQPWLTSYEQMAQALEALTGAAGAD